MTSNVCIASFLLSVALLGCGGGATETEPKTASITIGSDTTLLVEERSTLRARDENGVDLDVAHVAWVSSDASVATVDVVGSVAARGPGIATISATHAGTTGHMTLTVVPQFIQLATGETHTCGLTGRHQVYCWGMSARGELGPATQLATCESLNAPCSPTPVLAVTLRAQSLAAGAMFSCALDASGTASCWGANFYGQLGNGTQVDNAAPQTVQGNHHFVKLVAGRFHACGITDGQDAYCWGWDYTGQLGAGDVSTERCTYASVDPCSTTPRLVVGGHKWAQLVADDRATCGISADGDAFCWGLDIGGNDGLYCQEADDTVGCTRTPIAVGSAQHFKSITIGDVHRCEQTIDDTLECWGAQYWGAFGDGNVTGSATPVDGAGSVAYPAFVSTRNGMCSLDVTGRARCWGNDMYGQTGHGVFQDTQTIPVEVDGGWTFESLVSNGISDHVCGIAAGGGQAACWGRGTFGQLGIGPMQDYTLPATVLLVK